MNGNSFVKFMLRSPLHGMIDNGVMLITVTGRKSGKPITTPVNYLPLGNSLAIVSLRERTWWRNLRRRTSPSEDVAAVTVRLKGKDAPGRGEVIESDAEVAASLIDYLARAPQYAKCFQVRLNPDGCPNGDEVARAARSRVMVRVRLG